MMHNKEMINDIPILSLRYRMRRLLAALNLLLHLPLICLTLHFSLFLFLYCESAYTIRYDIAANAARSCETFTVLTDSGTFTYLRFDNGQ